MTSTRTGNLSVSNLKTQVYPLSDTSALGPRRLPEVCLVDNIDVKYSDKDKYIPCAGTIPMTFLGTPNTSWSAKEYGDNTERMTVLTSTAAITLPAVTGAANQAIGTLVYTFPAVNTAIGGGASFLGSFQASVTPAATPEVGMGTAIGTGAIATLGATMDNVLAGVAATDVNSTTLNRVDHIYTSVLSSATPALYLNLAALWAAADTIVLNAGAKIIVHWKPHLDIEQSGYQVV